MIKNIKNWFKHIFESKKHDRIIMVMHPKIFFPKGRIFSLDQISWTQYKGEPIDGKQLFKVISHVDFVHIKIRPLSNKNSK